MLVEVGKVKYHLEMLANFIDGELICTSGMKPPWSIPRRARNIMKDFLPFIQYWPAPQRLHSTICVGIQMSRVFSVTYTEMNSSCSGTSHARLGKKIM